MGSEQDDNLRDLSCKGNFTQGGSLGQDAGNLETVSRHRLSGDQRPLIRSMRSERQSPKPLEPAHNIASRAVLLQKYPVQFGLHGTALTKAGGLGTENTGAYPILSPITLSNLLIGR